MLESTFVPFWKMDASARMGAGLPVPGPMLNKASPGAQGGQWEAERDEGRNGPGQAGDGMVPGSSTWAGS